MRPIFNIRNAQHGVAIVEFVIILPLLLLSFLGIAELGRALYDYNTLTKATRDGARYLAAKAFNGSEKQIDVKRNDPELADLGFEIPIEDAAKNLVVCGQYSCTSVNPVLSGLTTANLSVEVDASALHVTIRTLGGNPYNFQLLPGNPLNGIIGLFGGSIQNLLPLTASVTMRAL